METQFCIFCDNKAEYIIDNTQTPICPSCKQVYVAGQANSDASITEIPTKYDE